MNLHEPWNTIVDDGILKGGVLFHDNTFFELPKHMDESDPGFSLLRTVEGVKNIWVVYTIK